MKMRVYSLVEIKAEPRQQVVQVHVVGSVILETLKRESGKGVLCRIQVNVYFDELTAEVLPVVSCQK